MKPTGDTVLARHKNVIFAAIEYILGIRNEIILVDGQDDVSLHYEKLRKAVEKDFQNGKLQKLERRLNDLLEIPRLRAGRGFGNYIKQRTGFDIDIFEGIGERVDAIIKQNRIRN